MDIKVVLEIVKSGLDIFSDERRRHFEKGLYERVTKVNEEKAKLAPHYSDLNRIEAEKDLEAYLMGYAKELKENIAQGVKHV